MDTSTSTTTPWVNPNPCITFYVNVQNKDYEGNRYICRVDTIRTRDEFFAAWEEAVAYGKITPATAYEDRIEFMQARRFTMTYIDTETVYF